MVPRTLGSFHAADKASTSLMALVNSEFRIYSPSASFARYILNQYFSNVQAETRSCSFGTDWRRLCTCTTPETTDWKANAWKVMGGLLLDFHVSFCTVFLDLNTATLRDFFQIRSTGAYKESYPYKCCFGGTRRSIRHGMGQCCSGV